jgi:hypothetical protein
MGDRIEQARSNAEDQALRIGHAVALLAMLGEHIGRTGLCPEDLECQRLGLRVEYLAEQIERHAADLNAELQKIERGAMALTSSHEVEEPSSADNVVRLAPSGDDAA